MQLENNISIVPLSEELVPQVAAIEAISFSEPWSEHAYREVCEKEEYFYLAAVDEKGKALGMCGLLIGPFEAEVMNVAVHPEHRGKGIAMKLIQTLLKEGEKRGVKEFTLEVRAGNAPAIHVYETCGFVGEGIRPKFYNKPVEDALIMWRR
jgi:ribosomal-protein-alanine N-acetyltransferase